MFPNGTCKNCPLGCKICYLKSENEISCNQCDDYLYEKGISNYTYIGNTFQCLSNTNESQLFLYGCLQADYLEEKKIFDCSICKVGFILIKNKKICKNREELFLS